MATDEWTEISGGGQFVSFKDIGDGVTGIVRNYSPDTGATTYDGDECGYLDIEDDDGLWTVTLDKGALRDPIARAAQARGLDFIDGTRIDVRYTEDRESKKTGRTYKGFTVRIAPASSSNGSKPKGRAKTAVGKAVEAKAGMTDPDTDPF